MKHEANQDESVPARDPDAAEVAQLPCREALAWIYEYLDGALETVPEAPAVAGHFRACRRCYPHLVLERSFREAVRRALATQGAPAELRESVLRELGEGAA